MSPPTRPRARRVEAVERAVAVLDVLAEALELGTNEIARRTGINASSVSRLLATLAASGLVDQVDETGRYRLGLRLVELGNAALARLDLRELARPHLRGLVAATGETATLSVPGEEFAITVDFVRSPASVQSVAQIGRPSVPHATAAGKVLLAFANVSCAGWHAARVHGEHDRGAAAARAGDHAGALAGVGAGSARTGGRPQRDRRAGARRGRRARRRPRRPGPSEPLRGRSDARRAAAVAGRGRRSLVDARLGRRLTTRGVLVVGAARRGTVPRR